jgi:hypothetical protein
VTDLFDAGTMYDDDYLHFLAVPTRDDVRRRGTCVPCRRSGRSTAWSAGRPPSATSRTTSTARARRLPDGDLLVDRNHLDPLTGRLEVERTVVRAGRARRLRFVVRLFGYPEIRDWLLAAGFDEIAGYGEDGLPLTADHDRMVVTARRTV